MEVGPSECPYHDTIQTIEPFLPELLENSANLIGLSSDYSSNDHMKRETLKVIRAQARKQSLPPNKVKPSGKAYKRHAKHRARLEQNQHGPFSFITPLSLRGAPDLPAPAVEAAIGKLPRTWPTLLRPCA